MCESTSAEPDGGSPPLSRIGLNPNKAGMEGLDREKINQIILEASKGSMYYQNEMRKDQEISRKIDNMLGVLKGLTTESKAAAMKAVDKKVVELEASRNLNHIIVHVDMDAFYAAIEMRDNPLLKDRPMAVGGNAMLVRAHSSPDIRGSARARVSNCPNQ
jgi:DNA polymerase kappa